MGAQVISFSKAFVREKDFRFVDKIERQNRRDRQQSLNLQKERLMNDFESMIQREDYFFGFLFEDIWQLYSDTVENFGKVEALKAIQKAKNRFSGRREAKKLIRKTETCIQNYHDFRESYIISSVESRRTALEFLFLCHNCGAEMTVIEEALNFLYKKKDFLMWEICRDFFVTLLGPNSSELFKKRQLVAEKSWEAFMDNCLNGSAEELALKFMVLSSADPKRVFRAIDLLKRINRGDLADICEKAVTTIQESVIQKRRPAFRLID